MSNGIKFVIKDYSFKDFFVVKSKDFFSPKSFKRDLKFFLALFNRSIIIKMFVNDLLVSYCLLVRGGGRHSFCSKKEYVISPYVVRINSYNNGYGKSIIRYLADNRSKISVKPIFAVVKKTNEYSIRVLSLNGFKFLTNIEKKGFMFETTNNNSEYLLFSLD